MSASANGDSTLQRVQNTRLSGSNDGISSRARPNVTDRHIGSIL
jgi:hypothetical protein